jgi:hypothetical protein
MPWTALLKAQTSRPIARAIPKSTSATISQKVKCAMKSEMCESECKSMPEANGENVAATEDNTAGSPEVSDIVASNSMDFPPVDQPHIKRNEDEGETTSESPDLGDTTASNPMENAHYDFALFCGQNDNILYRFCSDSPFKYYCSSKGKIAKTQANDFVIISSNARKLRRVALSFLFLQLSVHMLTGPPTTQPN